MPKTTTNTTACCSTESAARICHNVHSTLPAAVGALVSSTAGAATVLGHTQQYAEEEAEREREVCCCGMIDLG